MSWMEQLVQTYDENMRFVGKVGVQGTNTILAPIGHIIVKAKIDITLDGYGNLFGEPLTVGKDVADTLIPCTPESASRTSGLSPHPLHDTLQYIARDYELYTEEHKTRSINPDYLLYEFYVKKYEGGTKKSEKLLTPYEMHCKLLKSWCSSDYSHPKIEAVYQYIANHDVIQDLVEHKILFKDGNNAIVQRWNKTGGPKPPIFDLTNSNEDILKSFVRFRVDLNDGSPVNLWEDTEVQKCYERFCLAQAGVEERKLCYASGKEEIVTERHFKVIRFPGDGAKLISCNDSTGYTYRGRFEKGDECAIIGLEASHKAMNILRWLIRKQGYTNAKKVFLAWGRLGITPPAPMEDTRQIIRRRRNREQGNIPQTMQSWTTELHKALAGYRYDFQRADTAQVNLMILDAATSGRMSICYYSEIGANDFIDRIERWHKAGKWRQHNYDEETKRWWEYFGVPHPKRIVNACYGEKAGDNQVNMALERIFLCIVNGRIVPADMVKNAVERVVKQSVLATGGEYRKWQYNLLEPTCSLLCNRITFEQSVYEKEDDTVALDLQNRNRSYLYGRFLAVADKIERGTYNKEERDKRVTNAMKFMERFAQRPCSTWQML